MPDDVPEIDDDAGEPPADPSPEEIRARARAIQAEWSEGERQRRERWCASPWRLPTIPGPR